MLGNCAVARACGAAGVSAMGGWTGWGASEVGRAVGGPFARLRLALVPVMRLVLAPFAAPAPLALSDGWSVSLAVFQLGFSAVVSVTLWRLSAWQRRDGGVGQKAQGATARLGGERPRANAPDAQAPGGGRGGAPAGLRARGPTG